jgi:hypothetical protein
MARHSCRRWIRGHDLKADLGIAIEDGSLSLAAMSVVGI